MYLGEFVISIGAGWFDSSGGISNLEIVNGESTDDCEVACKNVNGCVGFTFVSPNKKCDLKNIQQAVTLANGFPSTIISGSIHFQVGVGDEEFCTSFIPCGEDEGDCDFHNECQNGLFCGSNNCPASLSFDSEVDCCVNCATSTNNGEIAFCYCNTCSEYEGDCDSDDECQHGLSCGSENCPASLGFDSEADCCSLSTNGDLNFCTTINPCGEYEGDCDSNDECQNGLVCVDNCPGTLLFDSTVDCCYKLPPPPPGRTINLDAKIEKEMERMSLHPHNVGNVLDHTHRMEYEEKFGNLFHSKQFYSHYTKRSKAHKKSKYSNSVLRKTSIKSNSQTELRNSAVASSKYGLTVILNPNEAEYTDALKNNYIGFKTLVHTPYNFAEVDAVGMAMGKNVQATVGIRGHHAFITDAANSLSLYQKKCLSRSDDMKKYKEVKLEIFAKYTRKGCILECHANIFYNECGCIPYHYPDFSVVWKKTTNCNHTALQCISKLVGK